MKLPPLSSHRAFAAGRLVSLFAAAVAFAPLLQAQAASDRRAAADDSKKIVELPPFAVVAGTGDGYLETMSTVGTRTNRPVIEIPQSITMITGKMLEDTLAFREEEALRYVPNVFPRNTYGQPGEYLIRGFEREGSTYLDGFSVPGYRRDSAGYEHMEVIKGPPSAVQGRSGASGAINWISKKPVHGKNSLNTKITYSTDDGYEEVYRAVVDGNQTLIDKGVGRRLSVRAVGVYQEGNSMIQYLPDDRRGFYPSVRWGITPKTELTFFGEFLDATEPATNIGTGPSFYARDYRDLLKDPVLGGDPNDPISALDIPFGRNPAGPHVIHWEEIRSGIVSITHRFTDNIHYRQGYQRFTEYDERRTGEPAAVLTQVTDVFNGQPGVWVPASYGGAKRRSARDSFQGDLYGQFNLTHTIRSTTLVGYEYWNYKEYKASHAYTLNPAYRRMNLANIPTDRSYWDDDKVIQSFRINDTDDDRIKNVSYYAQQEVDFWNRRLIASAAWRHDEQESWDLDDDGTIIETDDGTDSFRYGLTAFLNEKRTIAAYAVVSDAQDPELVRNVYSDGLAANDPRVDEKLIFRPGIELLEFGVKAELLDNRLSVSAAWFKQTMVNNLLRTGNMPVESPIGSGNIVSVNRASLADSTVEGWEFQAVGDLTQRFSVVTSLAFMDSSEVRLLDTGPITQEMHRVVDWNFNFFGRYDLRNERGNGFELRAGVNSYGPFIGTFSGIRLPVEHNFKQFDAGVRYTYGKNSIDFFVKNLTDEPIFIMRSTGGRAYRVTVSRTW